MRTSAPPLRTSSPLRRALAQVDWLLVGFTLILSSAGVLGIYSAIHSNPDLMAYGLHWKQALWSTIGLGVLAFILLFDYHHFTRMAYFFYGMILILLIAVFITGRVVYGAKRWLALGPMRLQPSEMARLAIILLLARQFGGRDSAEPLRLSELLAPFVLVMIPVTLIARQPDLGTAFTTFLTAAVMVCAVGVQRRILCAAGALAVALAPLGWFFLKDYQRNRILTLFNPDADPLGAGYQSMQSQIAVGSGEFWGKGLLQGTQSRLHFLPEKHTDFIFSVLSEELGFAGATSLLVLFLIFIHRCMLAALNAGDKEGALIATGVATSFFFYAAFNIGMTLGIIPIVGIPLPLVSYGGSASLTAFIAVGLVLNVRMRRRGYNAFGR
ncbi:MAG: rod shape-determining protein RodA [Nitrospinota bacterium]